MSRLETKKYAEVVIDQIKIPIEEILNELFSKNKFHMPEEYNTTNLNHFLDGKNILLKEFPVLQENLKYFKHLQNKIEKFNERIIYIRNFHYPKIFDGFIKTIAKKIQKFYEDFYKKTLADTKENPINLQNDQNEVSEPPKDVNFHLLRKSLKDQIIRISNEIFTTFSNKPQIAYEEEFTCLCEKIIRLNDYLISNESSVIAKTKINYAIFLTSLCSAKTNELSNYLRIDYEKLNVFLEQVKPYYPKNYPVHLSKTSYILESLHKIISDDLQAETQINVSYDIEAVARAVFRRDQKIINKEIIDIVRAFIDNKELKDETDDFERNIEYLTKDMQKLRSDAEILEKNPAYHDIIEGTLDVKFIEFMEETEENEELLMNIERLACDYYRYMKNSKDIFERMIFFTKEEELFYRNKYYQVLNTIIQNHEKEISKNNVETTIKKLFNKLQILIKKEKEHIPENQIENRLLNELEKNQNNPYLGQIFKDLQENEKKREIFSTHLRDQNKKAGIFAKGPEKNENQLKLLRESSKFVYKETNKLEAISPLAKSRSLQINDRLNDDTSEFSPPSPVTIQRPSIFIKNHKKNEKKDKSKDLIKLIPSEKDLQKIVSLPSDEEEEYSNNKKKPKKQFEGKKISNEPPSYVDLDSKISSNRSKKDRVTFEEFNDDYSPKKPNSGRANYNSNNNPLVENKKSSLKNIYGNQNNNNDLSKTYLNEDFDMDKKKGLDLRQANKYDSNRGEEKPSKFKEKSPPSSKRGLLNIPEKGSDDERSSWAKEKGNKFGEKPAVDLRKANQFSDIYGDEEDFMKKKNKNKSFDKDSSSEKGSKKDKKKKKSSGEEDSDHDKKKKKKKDKEKNKKSSDEDSEKKKKKKKDKSKNKNSSDEDSSKKKKKKGKKDSDDDKKHSDEDFDILNKKSPASLNMFGSKDNEKEEEWPIQSKTFNKPSEKRLSPEGSRKKLLQNEDDELDFGNKRSEKRFSPKEGSKFNLSHEQEDDNAWGMHAKKKDDAFSNSKKKLLMEEEDNSWGRNKKTSLLDTQRPEVEERAGSKNFFGLSKEDPDDFPSKKSEKMLEKNSGGSSRFKHDLPTIKQPEINMGFGKGSLEDFEDLDEMKKNQTSILKGEQKKDDLNIRKTNDFFDDEQEEEVPDYLLENRKKPPPKTLEKQKGGLLLKPMDQKHEDMGSQNFRNPMDEPKKNWMGLEKEESFEMKEEEENFPNKKKPGNLGGFNMEKSNKFNRFEEEDFENRKKPGNIGGFNMEKSNKFNDFEEEDPFEKKKPGNLGFNMEKSKKNNDFEEEDPFESKKKPGLGNFNMEKSKKINDFEEEDPFENKKKPGNLGGFNMEKSTKYNDDFEEEEHFDNKKKPGNLEGFNMEKSTKYNDDFQEEDPFETKKKPANIGGFNMEKSKKFNDFEEEDPFENKKKEGFNMEKSNKYNEDFEEEDPFDNKKKPGNIGGFSNNDFEEQEVNMEKSNKFDDIDVLDDLLPASKKASPQKKAASPTKKKANLLEEGDENFQEEEIVEDYYQDDFDEEENSAMKKPSNQKNQNSNESKSKPIESIQEAEGDAALGDLKFEPKWLFSKEDIAIIDQFHVSVGIANENFPLEMINRYDVLNSLLEEALAQEKAFFFTLEEGEKILSLLGNFHENFTKGGKVNAMRANEKEFAALVEHITNFYLQLKEQMEIDLNLRLFIPFDYAKNAYFLIEVFAAAKKVIFYYKKSAPNDKKHQDKIKAMMAILQEVFKFEEDLVPYDVIISPQSTRELDKYKGMNYFPYLATAFTVLYETDEGSHAEAPAVNFNGKIFERIFLISTSNGEFFAQFEKQPEGVMGHFLALQQVLSDGKNCSIVYLEEQIQEEADSERIAEAFYEVVAECMQKLKEINQIFVCLVIVINNDRFAYYVHLNSLENKEKNVASLYYLMEYDSEISGMLLQVFNSLYNDSFIFNCFFDFAKHNGLYEYSQISVTVWADFVLRNNLTGIEAFKFIAYSMIPFYIELRQAEGDDEEEGMEGMNEAYGEDFEIDEDMLPVGEV